MKHRMPSRSRLIAATISLIAFIGLLPVGGASADTSMGFDVITTGLDNPRGLTFRTNGELVVGEAGHAGEDACFEGGPEGRTCIGFTSQISTVNVAAGTHTPLATGFISVGDGPIGTTGIDGVAASGSSKVVGIVTASPQALPPAEACAGDATCLTALEKAKDQLGDLVRVRRNGKVDTIAEVGTFNYDYIVDNKNQLDPNNPDFQPGDANPYAVAAAHDGWYVVDGGSNTLDFVSRSGEVTVLAYLPNPSGPDVPYDAVPTCVAVAGDDVWIADLAGRVWNWDDGVLTQITVADDLLHATNGCATDKDGNLYVVDMFAGFDPDFFFTPGTGSVVRVEDHGGAEVIATGLNLPGGIAINKDGEIFVSNNAICPADVTGLPPQLCPSSGEIVQLQRQTS